MKVIYKAHKENSSLTLQLHRFLVIKLKLANTLLKGNGNMAIISEKDFEINYS